MRFDVNIMFSFVKVIFLNIFLFSMSALSSESQLSTWTSILDGLNQSPGAQTSGSCQAENTSVPTDCKIEVMYQACKEDQISKVNPAGILASFPDGTSIPDFKLAVSLSPRPEISQVRGDRIRKLVEFARSRIIENIKLGRAMSQLSLSEQQLVYKLQTISYVDLSQTPANQLPRACDSPNALYDQTMHSFYICPALMGFPDSTLTAVIGHELSHSIDPCQSQAIVYQLKATSGSGGSEISARMLQWVGQNPSRQGLLQQLIQGLQTQAAINLNSSTFRVDVVPNLFGPSNVKSLVQSGLFSTISGGSDVRNYPFNDVYSCLISPAGGGFKTFTTQQKESMAQIDKANYPQESASADESGYIESITRCEAAIQGKYVETSEAFADWMGANVLSAYLRANPPKSACDRLASMSVYQMIADGTPPSADDPHPLGSKRVSEIFFRNADLRSALGCTPSPKPACQHTTGVSATR